MGLPDITFLNPLPFPIAVSIAAGAAMFVFFSFYQFSIPTRFKFRLLLAFLRVLLLVLIFFIVFDPYWNRASESDWIGVLIDSSKSMAITDLDAKESRIDQLKQFVRNDNYWADLEKNTVRKIFSFDSKVQDVKAIAGLKAEGNSSRLLSAVKEVDTRFREDANLLGWIVFSDGAATDLPEQPAAGLFESFEIPWIAVSLGSEEEVPNVSLAVPELKETVFAGEIIPISIKWSLKGKLPEKSKLKIKLDGKLIIEKEVFLSRQKHDFEMTVKNAGVHHLDAELEALSEEGSAADNQVRAAFQAIPREIRVFYSESYYKDENYFKKSLEEDADFKVSFAASVVGFSRKYGVPFIKDPLYGFPRTREDLLQYDVIVLSDVKRALLSEEQISWIKELVEVQGGALVMVGGVDSFGDGKYVGTPIEQMLPLEISEEYKDKNYLKARGTSDNVFRPVISAGAETHPLLQLSDKSDQNRKLWETMPQLGGYNYVGRLKPAATLLLQHPVDTSNFGPRVIMAVQSFGRGKVLAFTSDVTPNWGEQFQGWKDEKEGWLYARFWRGALKWLTENRIREKSSPLQMSREPLLAESGREVVFKAALPNWDFIDGVLRMEVLKGKDTVHSEVFKDFHQKEISWQVPGLEAGDYLLKAVLSAKGQIPVTVEMPFTVHPSREESRHLEASPQTLKDLASQTQGVYLPFKEIKNLNTAAAKIRKINLRRRSAPYWSQWWIYLLLIAILCFDWFLRKRKGLE